MKIEVGKSLNILRGRYKIIGLEFTTHEYILLRLSDFEHHEKTCVHCVKKMVREGSAQ